jgi:hypothetical protein
MINLQDIQIQAIVTLLKELPKQKEFSTHTIEVARGKYKHKGGFFKRIKKLIND